MDLTDSCLGVLFLTILIYAVFSFRKERDLPPGPFPWPLVGSLFSITLPLHKFFVKLTSKYGPIIYMKIGTIPYLIINNAEGAREVLRNKDLEFFYRPESTTFKLFSLDYNNIGFCPSGETWKKLRRVTSNNMFSPTGLKTTARYRSEVMGEIRSLILETSDNGGVINLRSTMEIFSATVTSLVMLSEKKSPSVPLVMDALKLIGTEINISTLIPALAPLDLSGVDRRLQKLMPKLRSVLQEQIDRHRERKSRIIASDEKFECQDFMDVLISLKGEDAVPDVCIIGVAIDMIAAGIDTMRTTIEWAMAELIRYPDYLSKAQEEIDSVVGKSRLVQEADCLNLPYLQAVLRETLRLHTPVPLGAPHTNRKESEIAGYRIPANCKVIINSWAISRCDKYWEEPDTFKPERFLNSEVNFTGHDFEFLPFGGGRRMCVGIPFASRVVPFGIASLLQAFDWSPPPGLTSIDTTENKEPLNQPLVPVMATATPRLNRALYFSH